MTKAARIKETIRFTIIFLLVCYFGLIALVRLPVVQRGLSSYAEDRLARLFGTEVSVGNIDLGLLNRIIIRQVDIKDRNRDEMFHVSRLAVKFDLTPLLHGQIRISSVQLFGLDIRLRRVTPGQPLNCQFIFDTFAPEDTVKKKVDIDLRINSILIRRSRFRYDVASAPETKGKFNPEHIDIRNISATISLKAFRTDSLNAQVRRMSFQEQSGFRLRRFHLKATANRKGLYVNDLLVGLPQSCFSIDTLAITGESPDSIFRFNTQTRYGARLHAAITPSDFSAFVPTLKHFNDSLSLDLRFHGRGKEINCSELSLTGMDKEMRLRADGRVDAGSRPQAPYFFGNVRQLTLSETGISRLVSNLKGNGAATPAILERMGSVRFHGDISGYPTRFTAHGSLLTGPGIVNANVTMSTDSLNRTRTYAGKIESEDFRIGQLLGKEKLGNASFNLELEDFRYRNRKPETYVRGSITALEYNGYIYNQILLDGHLEPGGFNGHLALDDPNGNLTVDGSFLTQGPKPDFNLKAVLRNFKPNILKLTDKYQDTDMSLNLTADFTGHSIDDIEGQICLDSLDIDAPGDDSDYFLPQLQIRALHSDSSGRKEVQIHSPFLNGKIEGKYSYRTFVTSVRKLIQKHIPSLLTAGKELPETDNDFNFNLRMDNSEILTKAMRIPFDLHMPATFSGRVDDSAGQIDLHGYLPQFSYNGKYYESGTLVCRSLPDELQCQLRAGTLMKKGAMFNFSLNALAKDDKLYSTLFWGNNTRQTYSGKVDAVASFSQTPDKKHIHTRIDLQPSTVILNDSVWHIHPATVLVAPDSIEIRNFLFEHGDQYLSMDGRIGKTEADSCTVDMKNISLLYIMNMIQFNAVRFNGNISGKARLKQVLGEPVMEARLDVGDFSLNDVILGRGDITGTWDKEIEAIRLKADIRRDSSCTTRVDGYISPKQKGLELNIGADGTPLAFLQPFVNNIFSGVNGEAYGHVKLFGPFAELDLEGQVKARMGMKVNILNTYFEAKADSVRITPGMFSFKDVRLTDSQGHSGKADGSLRHRKLKDLLYQFSFTTDHMLVYNTTAATPEFPFYGQIYTTGNVQLRGGDGQLFVDGTMRADRQTSFAYILGAAAEATSSGFITFVDRTPRRKKQDIDTEVYHYLNAQKKSDNDTGVADIHVNLQIEPTERATMKIIMDPVAGDNISAHGTGNLRINFFNKGDFQMYGTYNILDGVYKMSLQNVIRKDFTLQPGGEVSFNGNPRNANLNVQAVYTVNSASLNDLIADASSSRGNVRVNCLLNLTGPLTSPNLKFDLELPTVSDEDQELVRSLTSTEEQMNTQIIYLLTVGKFYAYDVANNGTQTDATSSLAFSTLSGQLNNMLSQVISSQNWNVGTNLTTGEKGWSDVEAEAILSGRLLNNRLIINGNFGYRENTLQNSNFVGDFEAIWLLTPSGELRLRGYNQTNDRYFTKSTLTTQGIGLMYKKDFTDWGELFDWFLRRRRNRTSRQKQKEEQQYQRQEATLPAAKEKRKHE